MTSSSVCPRCRSSGVSLPNSVRSTRRYRAASGLDPKAPNEPGRSHACPLPAGQQSRLARHRRVRAWCEAPVPGLRRCPPHTAALRLQGAPGDLGRIGRPRQTAQPSGRDALRELHRALTSRSSFRFQQMHPLGSCFHCTGNGSITSRKAFYSAPFLVPAQTLG